MTYIIDAHQDIACNALTFQRDVRISAYQTRENERGTQIPDWNQGEATVGWPEFQQARIALIFATLWTPPWKFRDGDWDLQAHQNTGQGSRNYRQQLDYYRRLTEENPQMFRLVLNRKDLVEVLTPYQTGVIDSKPPVGLVILMEGAEGLREPEELEELYTLGLRQVGPVWAGTRYCAGTKEERPFDHEARRLLEVMASLKIPLDISHMTERSALTALDLFEGQVFASHANALSLLKGSTSRRHLTDTVIRRVFERDGVIGVVPYNLFLSTQWSPSSPRELVTLEHLADQIDYYCQIAGDSTKTGIGSDFDGGFGYPRIPCEMNTIGDLQKIRPVLENRGYTEKDIRNIFNLNWTRHLEMSLPA